MSRTKYAKCKLPVCHDTRECFGRENGRCCILSESYEKDGACKFCKPDGEVTNGKKYPIGKGVGIGGHKYAI